MSSLKELRKLAEPLGGTDASGGFNMTVEPATGKEPADNFVEKAQAAKKPASAAKTPTTITHNKGTYLVDATYHYFVNGPLSFNWWPLDDHTKIKEFNSTNKNWEKAVKAINLLTPVTGANSTAATPKDQQATTAPGTGPEAAKPTETKPAAQDASKAVLAEVLQAMYNNKLVGTKGIDLTNEQKMAVVFMDGITGEPGSGVRQGTNAATYLTALASYIASTTPATTAEAMASLPFLQSLQKALNAIYRNAMQSDPTFLKSLGVRPGMKGSIKMMNKYLKGMTNTKKATSKYPAKIIRLASLRRLRVRSEMEAAITSSAMPGRDRVS